jgi:hypothetical protein
MDFVGTRQDIHATIREENLNVYRASPQRLREDVGQENQIAQDYRGRLIYELLQNADDAMATEDSGAARIRFMLTDDALWVGNSGRPLVEADVRGLCGISASSKLDLGRKQRATIGHKGMGFKSVLEITDAPEVYSTTYSFRFGPDEALRAVSNLVADGLAASVNRAPITRFPWPVDELPPEWTEMRAAGMRTAFRFPLRAQMNPDKRAELADALINLPATTLLFLKHFRRVEFIVRGGEQRNVAWTVARERLTSPRNSSLDSTVGTGIYHVVLCPDQGAPQEFLLAQQDDISIGDFRGGLDEFSWESIELTEVSVAARLEQGRPIPLSPSWRKLHIFLPSGEPCPYDLLISGAFSSNVSRQEIRVELDEHNYNRFLLRRVAELLCNSLIPSLLEQGATVRDVLRLLDRGTRMGAPEATAAAQALYEEVRAALQDLQIVPQEDGPPLAPATCVIPPLVQDVEVGCEFRSLLPAQATHDVRSLPAPQYCGSDIARVLVDHGARALRPVEAAAVLASAAPDRSRAREDLDRGVWVDPVLSVLERLWIGMEPSYREEFAAAVRGFPLCPVNITADRAVQRIAIEQLECFYPPRSLSGEVPLDGLCFLARDLCWGALTPKERNETLRRQMEAWQALFEVREFKFPDVMRASVLPALELERSATGEQARAALRDLNRLAAICQLAGRTPNRNAPLPYERLGPNRALFNLSRLDVPCRRYGSDEIVWMPAYRVYFGDAWIGENSIEWVLLAGEVSEAMPDVHLLLEPKSFMGLLERFRHLEDAGGSDDRIVGEDEVGLDEDEEAALDEDDRTRWHGFFSWLGVNGSLRPVHFHDVEDRASGWLQTRGLNRPEGWAFQKLPDTTWNHFVDGVRHGLTEKDPKRFAETTPYFYRLHDLEHLVVLLEAAARDETAQLGRALYEHLARNWSSLERFAHLTVALIPRDQSPNRRTKPPRASDHEVVDAGDDLWVWRLQNAWFCPTEHGPRPASRVWLPTPEVQRRFGTRVRQGPARYVVPTLDVDIALTRGKARGFAQTIGIREELTPANFTVEDARVILDRLETVYTALCTPGADLRMELREVIRPAYRHLFELLPNRDRSGEWLTSAQLPLNDAPLLAQNGAGALQFRSACEVFYVERRETRDRLSADADVWTFVIEALPAARGPLTQLFGIRVLEEAIVWAPGPGEASLCKEDLEFFRTALWELGPYLLARVRADRADEQTGRRDARRLRRFIELVEPVTHLTLGCSLDGQRLGISADQRQAHVEFADDGAVMGTALPKQAFIVWGDSPWPPTGPEAEALATALCDLTSANYFESFLALIQANSSEARLRLLRRAGAPLDMDEQRALLRDDIPGSELPMLSEERPMKTAAPISSQEEPAYISEARAGSNGSSDPFCRTPLFTLDELLVDGEPISLTGPSGLVFPHNNHRGSREVVVAGRGRGRQGGYGGHTDLSSLDRLGMSVALAYERNRLRKGGMPAAIFDPMIDVEQPDALIFNVSSPSMIERARSRSPRFEAMMRHLQHQFEISPEWPGFDIVTLGHEEGVLDRLIELKSSGVDARTQEMSWNEWKVAAGSLRKKFYLYLVGNLRSDLQGSVPFVRTVRDPVGQLKVDVQENRTAQRKVQLAVHLFQEAEHLDLTLVPTGQCSASTVLL